MFNKNIDETKEEVQINSHANDLLEIENVKESIVIHDTSVTSENSLSNTNQNENMYIVPDVSQFSTQKSVDEKNIENLFNTQFLDRNDNSLKMQDNTTNDDKYRKVKSNTHTEIKSISIIDKPQNTQEKGDYNINDKMSDYLDSLPSESSIIYEFNSYSGNNKDSSYTDEGNSRIPKRGNVYLNN